MTAWIAVVGIGEDGLMGLGAEVRALVEGAEVLVGGERHLAMVPGHAAERFTWACGFTDAVERIADHRGRRVVVLASGDPLEYGAGAALLCRYGEAVRVVPAPGSVSLACARLGWSRSEIAVVTLHGRPLDELARHLAPGAKLVVLTAGGDAPAAVAALLEARGWGPSRVVVLEHLGGAVERRIEHAARDWPWPRTADLNVLGIVCAADPGTVAQSCVPGLPDEAYEHDGQLTKREVRAASLAALAPLPGQLLWDIGAGSGAVAIEWLRAAPTARAIAIERDPGRAARIGRNARTLGVPMLECRVGEAPAALGELAENPDAVFVGGGVAAPGLIEACWARLKPGGRLVANAVGMAAQARLMALSHTLPASLTRIAVERLAPLGDQRALKPLLAVLQLAALKQ